MYPTPDEADEDSSMDSLGKYSVSQQCRPRELGQRSRYSHKAMGWITKESGFDSQEGQDWLWAPPSLLYNGYEVLFPQGCRTDHSPPSIAKVKNDGMILPLPHMHSWHAHKLCGLESASKLYWPRTATAGKVIADFWGQIVLRGQHGESVRQLISVF
jgi:hypothetical protein